MLIYISQKKRPPVLSDGLYPGSWDSTKQSRSACACYSFGA